MFHTPIFISDKASPLRSEPLVNRLRENGAEFCFVTDGGPAKKRFNEYNIKAFTYKELITRDIQEVVTRWWNTTDRTEYAGYVLQSLLEYERRLFVDRPEIFKMAFQRNVLLLEVCSLRSVVYIKP